MLPLRQHQPFPALDGMQWFVCFNLEISVVIRIIRESQKSPTEKGALAFDSAETKSKCLPHDCRHNTGTSSNALSKTHVAGMLWNAGGCKLLVDQHALWSPISKLSRATCQPSVHVPGAYHSFAQRRSLLLRNDFCCFSSGMCLLHMDSIEVCANFAQEFAMGLRSKTGIYRYNPMIHSVRWEMKSISRSSLQTSNLFQQHSMSHHE